MLYHEYRLIDGERIPIEQPSVCLVKCFVECGWISLFSAAILTKDDSGLFKTFGTSNRLRSVRAISKCNQFSWLWWKIPSRNI